MKNDDLTLQKAATVVENVDAALLESKTLSHSAVTASTPSEARLQGVFKRGYHSQAKAKPHQLGIQKLWRDTREG